MTAETTIMVVWRLVRHCWEKVEVGAREGGGGDWLDGCVRCFVSIMVYYTTIGKTAGDEMGWRLFWS